MLFTVPPLSREELIVIQKVEGIRASLKYSLGTPVQRWSGFLRRTTLARAIRGSNSIEGYNVTKDDAMAVVEGEEPYEAAKDAWHAVVGYRNAMTYVLQLANDPHFSYNDGLIRSLHYMMLQYDSSKHPGRWRPGPIFIRDEQKNEIVYEGPDAELVPSLVRKLIESLNAADGTPVIVRAAMAHLNLTMIHPFSDGNGRMARCLQTLVMARDGILEPQFCSIEEYLGRNTQAYYDVLAEVGKGSWHPENDARQWIRFCLTSHYRQASTLLRRTKETHRVWEELELEVKKRGLPERVILALADAAFGYRVRNSTYRSVAEISENMASRDLKDLVDAGLLMASGERRGRYYQSSPILLSIRHRARESKVPEGVDPFVEVAATEQAELPFK